MMLPNCLSRASVVCKGVEIVSLQEIMLQYYFTLCFEGIIMS